ncbi:MAG: hypothetical protein ACLR7Z_02780 [Bilophila wadsworthia]
MHGGCDAAFALAFPVAFLLEIVPEVDAFRNVLRGPLALLGLGFGASGVGAEASWSPGIRGPSLRAQRIVAVKSGGRGARREPFAGRERLRASRRQRAFRPGCGNGNGIGMRAGRHRRIGGNGVLVYLAFKRHSGQRISTGHL